MLDYIHCYRNYRANVDWNTCGQAAIATMVDFWKFDPWGLPRDRHDPRTGTGHWDDGAAIDAVIGNGFKQDVVLGLGTSGGTIGNALQHYGLSDAAVAWSGAFSAGWEDRWRELRDHLRQDFPVPVLVDCGALGGTWHTAHWAIALRNADGRVTLGAMNGLGESNPTEEDFLHAWHCWFLPAGFNHCGVYAHR